jgi:hypothetical protein
MKYFRISYTFYFCRTLACVCLCVYLCEGGSCGASLGSSQCECMEAWMLGCAHFYLGHWVYVCGQLDSVVALSVVAVVTY